MKVLHQLLAISYILTVVTGGKRGRNLGIMIDTTNDMTTKTFSMQIDLITELIHRLPFAPGLPAVTIVTIGSTTQRISGPGDLVNRETLAFRLEEIRCCNGLPNYKTIKHGMSLLSADDVGKNRRHILLLSPRSFHAAGQKSFKDIPHDALIFVASKEKDFRVPCKSVNRTCLDIRDKGALEVIIERLGLSKRRVTGCKGRGKVYDECTRHCDCVNGVKTNCYRIRKEFTQMAKHERLRYLRTYLKLTTVLPFKYKYEQFVYLHQKYFCYGIHTQNLFCPWHRFYILQMENLLREIDCKVTIPYWDWSHVGRDPWNGSLWRGELGGNGDESYGFCVQSGMFREGKWKMPFFNDNLDIVLSTIDIYGEIEGDDVTPKLSDCLRRFFDGQLPDTLHVTRALALPAKNFSDFDINLRVNYHDTIHNSVGGTMCTHFAATSPEFFLHHAFLDKIWFMWQKNSPEHKNAFFANSTRKLTGFQHIAKELIDSHNLPGLIKVTYSQFPEPKRIHARDVDAEPDYVDDVNSKEGAVFHGIIQTSNRNVFPSCKRKKSERRRADYLDALFSRREK